MWVCIGNFWCYARFFSLSFLLGSWYYQWPDCDVFRGEQKLFLIETSGRFDDRLQKSKFSTAVKFLWKRDWNKKDSKKSQNLPPQHWKVSAVSLFLFFFFYFIQLPIPYRLSEKKANCFTRALWKNLFESCQENQRLSRNLTSSSYRKLKVSLKVWCTLTKYRIRNTSKGFNGLHQYMAVSVNNSD